MHVNNAGDYRVPVTTTDEGLDVRFVVNAVAPYLLTRRLLPLLGGSGRVVNLSSAAQAPVDLRAATGEELAQESGAYFDNDAGRFGPPHPDALDAAACAALTRAVEAALDRSPHTHPMKGGPV